MGNYRPALWAMLHFSFTSVGLTLRNALTALPDNPRTGAGKRATLRRKYEWTGDRRAQCALCSEDVPVGVSVIASRLLSVPGYGSPISVTLTLAMASRSRATGPLFSRLVLLAVSLFAFLVKSDAELPAGIPGTRHKTAQAAEAFRAAVDCSARGKWVYNPNPRIIPWMRKPWNGLQLCDHTRFYTKVGVAGPRADAEAITHGNWSVRESLKWEWAVDEPDTCLWEEFNRSEFCRSA